MGRHTRRAGSTTIRRAGIPLVALGVGLVPLGVAPASASPAAPVGPSSVDAPAGESGTMPCAATVKACARLSTNEAWLADGQGRVLRGPIRMSHGAVGQETPPGTFTVQRKDAQHVSQEQPGVKMPWSVFFDTHGRAFHGGSTSRESAGCVHLDDADAKFFFDHLKVGDSVQILP